MSVYKGLRLAQIKCKIIFHFPSPSWHDRTNVLRVQQNVNFWLYRSREITKTKKICLNYAACLYGPLNSLLVRYDMNIKTLFCRRSTKRKEEMDRNFWEHNLLWTEPCSVLSVEPVRQESTPWCSDSLTLYWSRCLLPFRCMSLALGSLKLHSHSLQWNRITFPSSLRTWNSSSTYTSCRWCFTVIRKRHDILTFEIWENLIQIIQKESMWISHVFMQKPLCKNWNLV